MPPFLIQSLGLVDNLFSAVSLWAFIGIIYPNCQIQRSPFVFYPWRFDNSNQLLKIAGYDLNAQRSGKKSNDAIPVISKRGNGELRYALYQAAHVASTRNPEFIRYFTRMLRGRERERGIKTKMKVKLAAKMLKIAWTLMKKNQGFDPDYLITA